MQFTELFLWYIWMQAYGFGGSLIARAWLRSLPDRGYGVGKAAGLVFGAFVYWISVTLGWASNTAGAALLGLAVVWALGIAANGGRRAEGNLPSSIVGLVTAGIRRLPSVVIVTEALLLVAFVGWAYVRAFTPEITDSGGEKFMESMMINAIVRAPTFPPNDAWLTGLPISYYYFGYIVFAMLIKVSGAAPSIAFNLGGAMIFALTFVGAFSVGFNVWAARRVQSAKSREVSPESRMPNEATVAAASGLGTRDSGLGALAAGLLTALMLTLMGNMGGLMGALKCANSIPAATWQWLDVRDTATKQPACAAGAPIGWFEWWWDWSRVIKDYSVTGGEQEIITEAPIFSFVLGDNHPHTLALPMVMLAIALALAQFMYRGYAHEDYKLTATSFVLNAIALGAIGFTNTIDFPIYAALFLIARVLARFLWRESLILPVATGVATVAMAYLIYLPFHVTLKSQVQGIVPNLFNGTRFAHFFLMFAPMTLAATGLLVAAARDSRLRARVLGVNALKFAAVVIAGSLFALAFFGLLSSEARALVQELQNTGSALGATREQITARLFERLSAPWTALFLAGVIAVGAALLFNRPIDTQATSSETGHRPATDHFALTLLLLGALLVLSIEFVYLRDFFGTRMNSVFKFWYQAWTLWAVMGAYATMRLFTAPGVIGKIGGTVVALFVAAGLLWPVMAIPAKWAFSQSYNANLPTLDSAATLKGGRASDAAAIDWLNKNVTGTPVVLEAPFEGSYNYRGRISTFTGLPTVLGWAGHEGQWRGSYDEQGRRKADIDQIYSTLDPTAARELMKQYKIAYVVVGPTEREPDNRGSAYPPEGLEKFAQICATAYVSGETTVYRCNP